MKGLTRSKPTNVEQGLKAMTRRKGLAQKAKSDGSMTETSDPEQGLRRRPNIVARAKYKTMAH